MSKPKSVFHNILLLVVVSILTLSLLEVFLRVMGRRPGYSPEYAGFHPVKTLVVTKQFYTDEEGVFKANPEFSWPDDYTINAEGFRGREFTYIKGGPPKILFLGDSFTWGASARPITNCFVDIIGRSGAIVYNAGIPGTGPKQYAYLAKKWIPKLKPDIVCTMFYMGNDFNTPERMIPNQDEYYITNAGWLKAYDEKGVFMTAQEAYQKYVRESNLVEKAHLDDRVKSLMRRTSIGTLFLAAIGKLHLMLSSKKAEDKGLKRKRRIIRYLWEIQSIAKANKAIPLLFLIPVHPDKDNSWNDIRKNLYLFKGLNPIYPTNLDKNDYVKLPNGHLSNSGHRKFARLIEEHLHLDRFRRGVSRKKK